MAEATSRDMDSTRWSNYELYRTRAGKYVLVYEYVTLWQGERCERECWVSEEAAEVFHAASEYHGRYEDALVELAREAGIDISKWIE